MKEQLIEKFELIQNKNINKVTYDPHFEQRDMRKFIRMHSIKDESKMEFIWIFDNLRKLRRYHVEDYIKYILEKNPLIATLQEEEYASEI